MADTLSRKKEVVCASILVSKWKLPEDTVSWKPFVEEDCVVLSSISVEAD